MKKANGLSLVLMTLVVIGFYFSHKKSQQEKALVDSQASDVEQPSRHVYVSSRDDLMAAGSHTRKPLLALVENQINEGLFRQDPDGNLIPGLATSVTSNSESSWEVTLRPNLVFSDGSPASAQGLVDLWNKNARSIKPTANQLPVLFAANSSSNAPFHLKIKVTGNDQLQITSSLPVTDIRPYLTNRSFFALQLNTLSSEVRNKVSIGPFRIKSLNNGSVHLEKDPNYYDVKNMRLDELQLTMSDTPNVDQRPLAVIGLEVRKSRPFKDKGYGVKRHSNLTTYCYSNTPTKSAHVITPGQAKFANELRGVFGLRQKSSIPSSMGLKVKASTQTGINPNANSKLIALAPEAATVPTFIQSLLLSHQWSKGENTQLEAVLTSALKSKNGNPVDAIKKLDQIWNKSGNVQCGYEIWQRYLTHPRLAGLYSANGQLQFRYATNQPYDFE